MRQLVRSITGPSRRSTMPTRVLTLSLLAAAIATGCQSSPEPTQAAVESSQRLPGHVSAVARESRPDAADRQASPPPAGLQPDSARPLPPPASTPVPAAQASHDRIEVSGTRPGYARARTQASAASPRI